MIKFLADISGIAERQFPMDIYYISERIESFNLSYFSHQIICKECSLCDLKNICGGGMVAHRFKSENEFNNPSVYCEDIKYIINHINNYLINIVEETHENIN